MLPLVTLSGDVGDLTEPLLHLQALREAASVRFKATREYTLNMSTEGAVLHVAFGLNVSPFPPETEGVPRENNRTS